MDIIRFFEPINFSISTEPTKGKRGPSRPSEYSKGFQAEGPYREGEMWVAIGEAAGPRRSQTPANILGEIEIQKYFPNEK